MRCLLFRCVVLSLSLVALTPACGSSTKPAPLPDEADAAGEQTGPTPDAAAPKPSAVDGAAVVTGADAARTVPADAPVDQRLSDAGPGIPPAAMSAGCGKPAPTLVVGKRPNSTAMKPQISFSAAGEARTAVVRVPPGYRNDHAYPLIVLFHGYGNNGDEVDGQMGVYDPARQNAVIISPDALDRSGGNKPGWETKDVPVLDELAAWAQQSLCIDPGRVFIAGVSNGAMMVNTMACARGNILRGVAVVAGVLPTMTNCQRPIAMVGVHSMKDTQVPYTGGIKSRDYWKGRDGCQDKMLMPAPCDSFPGCQADRPVAWCEHEEGVYQIKDATGANVWTYHGWPRMANEAVWTFFSKL